jgi:hypothetical protein
MLSTELGPAGGWLADAERDDDAGRRIVMLYANAATQANLTAWADAVGFDVGGPNPHEGHAFHITLLATVNDVAIPLTEHLIEPVAVVPIGCGVLGRDQDTPVMLLALSDQLEAMRAYFVETYGAEPTFDFKPHISVSYNWNGEPDMRDRDLPDFDLVFDRLVVDAFDGEKAMAQDRKGVLDWLLGQRDDEQTRELRQGLAKLNEQILAGVAEVDDISGMVAETVAEGDDIVRLQGLRLGMIAAMDEIIRLSTHAQALQMELDGEDKSQSLQQAISDLEKAA